MTRLPDLASLRLLASVAHRGSIGAAGRDVGISQQSASERLRAMESQTGLVLVQRSTAGSRLTPAGRLLVDWTTGLLDRADEVEVSLSTLRHSRSRQLRVSASMTTAEFLVPGWLVRLRRESDVAASLQAGNSDAVLVAVRSGHAELGFIEGPADLSGLASRVVGHDQLMLVAAADDPWAGRRTAIRPEQVARRRLTSREAGSGTRHVVERAFRDADVEPPGAEVELTTTASVLAAVRAGSPPAFVSDRAATAEIDSGRLVRVTTSGLALSRPFTAVWVGGPRPPAGPVRDLLAIAMRSAGSAAGRSGTHLGNGPSVR